MYHYKNLYKIVTIKPLQNVAMKSFTWLFLTTASLQVAKNHLTLERRKFTTSQLSS